MHPDWAREIRDACLADVCAQCGGEGWIIDHERECYEAGECVSCGGVQVPCCDHLRPAFFFKQWGEWTPVRDGRGAREVIALNADGSHLPANNTAEDWFKSTSMRLVGKKRAGRQLDGREWNEMPQPQAVPA